ncbi:MAG: DUF4838 domain-containing protein [Thermoguttaceae bacterium]|nr:DUF4838 domain-containing protein [Thermoguttaceae bacterium]
MRLIFQGLLIAALVAAACGAEAGGQPPAVALATGGRALLPIVVGENASERTRAAAATLGAYLGRITGAALDVKTAADGRGIAVGLARDFPESPLAGRWSELKSTEREDYLLRTAADGVYLLGATELAVEHAVWDFLYRLGHRQFMPGEPWQIVPRISELSVALDAEESPDYIARRIWYGFGVWDYNAEPYADWCARNRATSGIALRTGHAYGGLIRGLKAQFDQHPEFYALVDGKRDIRGEAKLCIGNPELRRLVVEYAVGQFDRDGTADSISTDPSDGGGWCECERCAELGSITDRALLLANEVAAGVNRKYPGKLVGLYAYNFHSPPPGIRAHEQVVVSVATAFLKGGLSLDEILDGWSRQASILGIREYYSVNTWDRDMPGQARGSNLEYLKRTIPAFHRRGARFMSAESSDNWGPNGLGYYLAARMLWDIDEAERMDELIDDFLARSFGPAREPMAEFYRQLDGSKPHLVFSDQLGRMFRSLAEARRLAGDADMRARIDDLLLYARYVDLYQRYAKSEGPARQAAFEQLIRHAYRMRTTMLVHTKALYRDLANRDKSVSIPPGAEFHAPEGKNPWKSSAPFGADELAAFLRDGIARYPLATLDFQPVEFSSDLVPAAPLGLAAVEPGKAGPGRHEQTFFTFFDKAPATLQLRITGGLIAHYRDRGNVRVELWKIGGETASGERETLAGRDRSVAPDGVERTVKLPVALPGLYKLVVRDGGDRTQVAWPTGQRMTIVSTADAPMNTNYASWMLYFYVPKGTKVVGLHGGGHGEVHDSAGRPLFWLNGREPGYYSVEVPQGQDGRLWRIRYGRGPLRLLTVPPCLARSAEELLLPKEVVEADGKR